MISLKFVPKVLINNIPALIQIMAWRQPGAKSLSELMMVKVPTPICITRPQWVKLLHRTGCCEHFSFKSMDFRNCWCMDYMQESHVAICHVTVALLVTSPVNVSWGWEEDISLRGWILKPVHQASHPWLPTSALQGASHPVSNQHNGAPRVPMSTDPVEAVTRKGHQVTMGLLSQDPKWLTTHMCWHAKQCRKCICRMHNLLFNHYATHWGWVKHLTSSIIFMI